MFKLINNIKETVTVLAVITTIGLGVWGNFQKQEAERATSNLYSKTIQWEDAKGRLVTEVTELRFTTKELKRMSKKDSSKLNETEIKLYKAHARIVELGLKPKNVERIEEVKLKVITDSLITKLEYEEDNILKSIAPIRTPFLALDFEVKKDSIIVTHKYNSTINTILNRRPDRKTKKNKKRFFLARWINPRYTYWSTAVSDDPNAEIESLVSINFQKSRGKKRK